MSSREWRYANASVIGTSHKQIGTSCQDHSFCNLVFTETGEGVLVAIVADGAGSARFSHDGSRTACTILAEEIRTFLMNGNQVCDLSRELVTTWLITIQEKLTEIAEMNAAVTRDYACTLLAAIVGEACTAFIQIGDGAIVTRDDMGEYSWIFWPNKGEFENTTYFVTESTAFDHLNFDIVNHPIDEVALFTDGIQHLALHYQTMTAYSPFFKPMFAYFREQTALSLEQLEMALTSLLNSEIVNLRTDDDKTLVLATRCGESSDG